MAKKFILILTVAFFFSGFNLAQASVVINEVQIKPTGESFVELYNSDVSQDLTGWSIKRKTASGTEYSFVSASHLKDKSISNGSYFLLANEGDYAGSITPDATWAKSYSLANDNTILLYDANGDLVNKVGWGSVNDCDGTCAPNPIDDESIQRTGDGWIIATPTPKAENSSSSDSNNNENLDPAFVSTTTTTSEGSASSSSSIATPPKPKVVENLTMKAKIMANALAFTGQPFEIKTNVSGFSNENVVLGRVYWNFGDGGSFEQINNFEKFYHTYYYPGEYVLFLEYYQNNFSKIPEATSKMIIKVLSTTVTISKVGDAKDFFIELSNNAQSDIDISNWVINASGKSFILPKNSVIMSKKKTTISSKITGFTYGDQHNLKLFSSTGELVFDYASPIESIKILAKNSVPIKISTALQPLGEAIPPPAEQISAENLLATPAGAQVSVFPPLIIPLASLFFIGTSAGVVYFIRRKKIIPQTGSDFEILDE